MDDTPAVYVGGSGSPTLHFRYTVRSGDNTGLLDVHGFDLRRGRILRYVYIQTYMYIYTCRFITPDVFCHEI